MVRPSTGGERIVIVDFVSGIVSKSPSCLDAKRVLYPVNDIKVFYEYIRNNVTNFCSPLKNAKKMKKVTKQVIDFVTYLTIYRGVWISKK